MLYTSLSARWRSSPVQLPDGNNLDDISETQKIPPERLTGRRILLLWLPALCDLAGSTVRPLLFLQLRDLSYSLLCERGFAAHERRPVIYPRVDLHNDAGSTGAVRWDSFRPFLGPQAVPLPVSVVSPDRTLPFHRRAS
jgi:hypothetical protein